MLLSSLQSLTGAMATYGVIYASNSKMIRRVISGSSNLLGHVGPGESLLTVQAKAAPSVFDAQTAVHAATGQAPLDLTCAVIDATGNVVRLIKADSTFDQLPAMSLVAAPSEITKGCTYDAANGWFVIPQQIIPAHTDKDGNPVAEQTIAAKIVMPIDVAAAISAAQSDVVVDNP